MPTAYGRVYKPKKRTGYGDFAGGGPRYAKLPGGVAGRSKNGRSLQEILDARTTPSSRARAQARYGPQSGLGARSNPNRAIDVGFPRRRLPKPGDNAKRRYF